MSFRKSKWLNEYNPNKPKCYLRYVDDILVAFDKQQNSLNLKYIFLIIVILKLNLR